MPGPHASFPRLIQPPSPGAALLPWAERARSSLRADLASHGAILLRGFAAPSVAELEQLIAALTGEAIEYTQRSTPRTRVAGRIFTSTEYPADQTIPQHNEMSYARSWPGHLFFLCCEAPASGGETPISDSRRVYQRISPSVRERFARHGVMYVCNYRERVGLSWQEAFQTGERSAVEAQCLSAGIWCDWQPDGRLRTTQVCQAALAHPATGAMVWFNQAHLFHVSNLQPRVQRALLANYGEEALPRNAYYGDGSRIESSDLDEVRAAYDAEEVAFPWQEGDVLVLDNLLAAHGRRPFAGPRRIVVGMSSEQAA